MFFKSIWFTIVQIFHFLIDLLPDLSIIGNGVLKALLLLYCLFLPSILSVFASYVLGLCC